MAQSVAAQYVQELINLSGLFAVTLPQRVFLTLLSHGPAPMPTPVLVAHVAASAGGRVTVPVPAGWAAAFTVVAGVVASSGRTLVGGNTPVFNDDGATVTITSDSGGEVLLMCGEPISEPVAMGGGFVMNTPEEIAAAFGDDEAGRMGRLTPTR